MLELMVLLGTLIGLFPVSNGELSRSDTSPVDWSCQVLKWTHGPDYEEGVFHGTIQADCEFKGLGSGKFAELNRLLGREIISKAKQVHSGPCDEIFEGIPSQYFDLTETTEEEGIDAIRSDVHLATNHQSRLMLISLSKEIIASGASQNVKRVDKGLTVTPLTKENSYELQIAVSTEVEKPALVPVNVFIRRATEVMEEKVKASEEPLLQKMASYL